MNIIQGLLVDPAKGTAEIFSFSPDLAEFYRLLGCDQISGCNLFDEVVSCIIVEAMPATFASVELGGIPCTISRKWTQPICGPFIVTGAPDEEGESTSITRDQITSIIKEIVPAVCKVVNGQVKYKIRGHYSCIVPSNN
jgi:hypothetical protein